MPLGYRSLLALWLGGAGAAATPIPTPLPVATIVAIREYLDAAWTTTPLVWENEAFSLPSDPAPFVEVELVGRVYGQQSIGANSQATNRWDEEGTLFLNVHVVVDTGSFDARTYAKSLADLFRALRLMNGTLEFRDAFIGLGRPASIDGNYFMIPVNIEWRRWDA